MGWGGWAPRLAERLHLCPKRGISHRLHPFPPLSAQASLLPPSPILRRSQPSVTDPYLPRSPSISCLTFHGPRLEDPKHQRESSVLLSAPPASPLTHGSPTLTIHGHPLQVLLSAEGGCLGPPTSSSYPSPAPWGGASKCGANHWPVRWSHHSWSPGATCATPPKLRVPHLQPPTCLPVSSGGLRALGSMTPALAAVAPPRGAPSLPCPHPGLWVLQTPLTLREGSLRPKGLS